MSFTKVRIPGRGEALSGSEQKLNLSAVSKIDEQAIEIKRMVFNVVLYKYDGYENKWERSSTEGTLFVYKRVSKPFYGFIILNRLNSENCKELLCPEMELRIEHSFVLFKRKTEEIFGLCFPEETSAHELGTYLEQMASVSLTDEINKSGFSGFAFRSSSAPHFHINDAPASRSSESLEPSLPEMTQVDSNGNKERTAGVHYSSYTSVKKTEKNKQVPKQKLHPVQQESIMHTSTHSQSSCNLLQSMEKSSLSSELLISPRCFHSENADSDSKMQAVGVDTVQSLLSNLKTTTVDHPAGAFSLAEVENKLQMDSLGQASYGAQVPLGQLIGSPQTRSGHILMQPSVYEVLPPISSNDAAKCTDTIESLATNHKVTLTTDCSSTSQSEPQLPVYLKSTNFPSAPPLMLSAGMKASPIRELHKNKGKEFEQHKSAMSKVSPLTKDELQMTLLHLIEHDDDFLSYIHKTYLQTCTQNRS